MHDSGYSKAFFRHGDYKVEKTGMQVFVINLDKNTDRLEFMNSQLETVVLEYERVSAVYGVDLSKEELRHSYSAFRAFCAMGRRLRAGEIGCALSHCEVYRRMASRNIQIALVLEDDVIINDFIPTVIKNVESYCDVSKPQVILLSAHGIPNRREECCVERIHGGACADGYVITLPAARQILKANTPVVSVVDKWRRWERLMHIEMYRAWPTTVSQDNDRFGTDINDGTIRVRHGVNFVLHKISRLFGCTIDYAWHLVSGR